MIRKNDITVRRRPDNMGNIEYQGIVVVDKTAVVSNMRLQLNAYDSTNATTMPAITNIDLAAHDDMMTTSLQEAVFIKIYGEQRGLIRDLLHIAQSTAYHDATQARRINEIRDGLAALQLL